jgi:hypothetical protein
MVSVGVAEETLFGAATRYPAQTCAATPLMEATSQRCWIRKSILWFTSGKRDPSRCERSAECALNGPNEVGLYKGFLKRHCARPKRLDR